MKQFSMNDFTESEGESVRVSFIKCKPLKTAKKMSTFNNSNDTLYMEVYLRTLGRPIEISCKTRESKGTR